MNRLFVIVALTVLFSCLAQPFPSLAQTPGPSTERAGNTATGKNAVSLTTTDLLSSQDFVPQVTAPPAQRSRFVSPVKKSKKGFDVTSSAESEPSNNSNASQKRDSLFVNEISAEVMISTQRLMRPIEETRATSESVPPIPLTSTNRVDDLIAQSAQRNGVDHHLILAVMKQESSFNPQAVSYKGARGLMQLMPATAVRFGVRDIFDPAQNIEGGARYLRFLLDTFNGDIELALAGYNAGEGAVMRYGNQIPPYRETQDYVRKISAHYARLKNGGTVSVPRTVSSSVTPKKQAEMEVITVGRTMTQY